MTDRINECTEKRVQGKRDYFSWEEFHADFHFCQTQRGDWAEEDQIFLGGKKKRKKKSKNKVAFHLATAAVGVRMDGLQFSLPRSLLITSLIGLFGRRSSHNSLKDTAFQSRYLDFRGRCAQTAPRQACLSHAKNSTVGLLIFTSNCLLLKENISADIGRLHCQKFQDTIHYQSLYRARSWRTQEAR